MKNCKGLHSVSAPQSVNKTAAQTTGASSSLRFSGSYQTVLLLVALVFCLFLSPIATAQILSYVPDWQTDIDNFVNGQTIYDYVDVIVINPDTGLPEVTREYFHAAHLRGESAGGDRNRADRQDITVLNSTVTMDGTLTAGFWVHGQTDNIDTIIAFGGMNPEVPVTNSTLTFDTLTINMGGTDGTGLSTQLASSTLNITNSKFNVTGSGNYAVIVPGVSGYTGEKNANTINIDSSVVFDFASGGNNTAIALGASYTELNVDSTLVLNGNGDTGIQIGEESATAYYKGYYRYNGAYSPGGYYNGMATNNTLTGSGGLNIEVNSRAGGRGIANFNGVENGLNTVIGATITVGGAVASSGRIWSGNAGIVNNGTLTVEDSTITTTEGTITTTGRRSLTPAITGATNVAIKNGFDESIHIVEQPELVWQIQYDAGGGVWVDYTDDTADDVVTAGTVIRYRLAIAPDEDAGYNYYREMGPWTRRQLGEGFSLSESTITLSEGGPEINVPEPPDDQEEAYLHYYMGESLANADAVLVVDNTTIEASAIAIENHGTVTIQNDSRITLDAGGIGIFSEYMIDGVQDPYGEDVEELFVYSPRYNNNNIKVDGSNNNIKVDGSVITGAGSTAIKTQNHLFYRIAEPDEDPIVPQPGPEDGYYTSFIMRGWMGRYDAPDDDAYAEAGRNIDIVNGSKLGEVPDGFGGERVRVGIDFSGDMQDIYIDSTSEINATEYGIRSTAVPIYGWDDTFPAIGHYAGTLNRIVIEGKVEATTEIPGMENQTAVVGRDPVTHKLLPYDFSNPETDDFKKYVTQIEDPITTQRSYIPAIDPRTGKPYVDPKTGAQIVTIKDENIGGTGLYITGDSIGWDIIGGPDNGAWSGYYGPVVSDVAVIGQNALLYGGSGTAIQIDDMGVDNTTHVGKISSGRNDDVASLFAALNQDNDKKVNANNWTGVNGLTVQERAFLLKNNFDKAGVNGDIVSWYNGVAGWVTEERDIRVSNTEYLEGGSYDYTGFNGWFGWWQVHDGTWTSYFDTIGGSTIEEANFRSKLFGHRDLFPNNDTGILGGWWTTVPQGTPSGRSVILDEILLQKNYAVYDRGVTDENAGTGTGGGSNDDDDDRGGGTTPAPAPADTSDTSDTPPSVVAEGSFDKLRYRQALQKLLDSNTDQGVENITGLTKDELKEGLTRDGTLLKFGDDIFSGTIWGGGFGSKRTIEAVTDRQGNIDVQFTSFTAGETQNTIFNNNTAHVRNAHVKADGHLLLNNATFIVDQYTDKVDATRLVIHDFINEGKVSGNGSFELSERGGLKYAGNFVNEGVLAPGLPGYHGTNYDNATWTNGGQLGEFNFKGSLHLESSGTLEMTLSDVTVGDMLAYYTHATPPAGWRTDLDPAVRQTFWDLTRQDKTAKRLAWIDNTADVVPAILRAEATALEIEIANRKRVISTIPKGDPRRQVLEEELYLKEKELAAKQPELDNRTRTLAEMTVLLQRYGMSDLLDVSGMSHITDPYFRDGENISLGGTLKVDKIWDPDSKRETLANKSYIIAVSDKVAKDSDNLYKAFANITSDTIDVIFANTSVMPNRLATGQYAVVLSVVDDKEFYRNYVGKPYNSREVARALDDAMFTNPGLAQSLSFDMNSPEVLRDVTRQMAASSRANSVIMNLWSPSNTLFNQIGYGQGGMSTGNRGNVVFKNAQSGRLTQPYGQPAVPPPGMRYAAPQGYQNGTVTQPQYGQYRGQSPMYRNGSVWGNFVHSSFAMGDDKNSFRYTFDRNGVFVGNEWNLTPSTAWGYTGWANYGTMRERWDKTTGNDYGLGLYLVAAPYEQFEVKTFFGFGFQQYKNDRYLRNDAVQISHRDEIFGIDEHYNSEVDGHSTNFSLELARPFTVSPNFVIRPVWGFEIQVMTQGAYSEHPDNAVAWSNSGYNIVNGVQGAQEGNYALNFKRMEFARSLTRIGFNTESYFARGGWQSRLYYANRFSGDKAPISTQYFQSGSIPFKSKGGNLGSSYLQLGAGTHYWLNRDRTATLYFDADWDTSFGHGGYSWLNFTMGLQQNF